MTLLFALSSWASIGFSDYSAINCPTVLERFQQCKINELLFYSKDGSTSSQFIPQIQCHFENQSTLYAYVEEGRIRLDANGENLHEFTAPADCQSLSDSIFDYAQRPAPSYQRTSTVPLSQKESILVVASRERCENWKAELNELLDLYKNEGRTDSALLCVSQTILKTKNPAKIRQLIQTNQNIQSGILLIGEEIPTFEIFYHTGYTGDWSAYGYGHTDLPYGDSGTRFWNEPLMKTSVALRNKVYHDANYMYLTTTPTPFAYNVDTLVATELGGPGVYHQSKWVSRWMGERESLRNFLARRREYKVSRPLRMTVASGSEGVFWRPHEKDTFEMWVRDLSTWPANDSEIKIFSHSDLDGIARNLDSETDVLVTSEHGQPEAVGNLHASRIVSMPYLPPILDLDTCLGGAWGYATDPESSLIYKSLKSRTPPLVILASSGIKWTRTIGTPDNFSRRIFMAPDALGKSMGQQQLATFSENWAYWRLSAGEWWNSNPPASAHQLFHNFSLFGDGTIEM